MTDTFGPTHSPSRNDDDDDDYILDDPPLSPTRFGNCIKEPHSNNFEEYTSQKRNQQQTWKQKIFSQLVARNSNQNSAFKGIVLSCKQPEALYFFFLFFF